MTDADQILFLEKGRITAAGTHLELLSSSPAYAQLYRMHQSGHRATAPDEPPRPPFASRREDPRVTAVAEISAVPQTSVPAPRVATVDPAAPLAPGAEVAPGYTVADHLRRGEDFDTYDAWCAARYSRCFVKTPRPDRVHDVSVRRTLVREGRLLLASSHPHLVRAYELHAPRDGAPALVLEALPGPSLKVVLERASATPGTRPRSLGRHLCSAARYLHGRGHLHLDIKPSNVVIGGGAARLIDLGLSRSPGPCRAGVGTARNMAPEQARGGDVSAGDRRVGHRVGPVRGRDRAPALRRRRRLDLQLW